jgi:GNAT superfamily N-acetyltransferase
MGALDVIFAARSWRGISARAAKLNETGCNPHRARRHPLIEDRRRRSASGWRNGVERSSSPDRTRRQDGDHKPFDCFRSGEERHVHSGGRGTELSLSLKRVCGYRDEQSIEQSLSRFLAHDHHRRILARRRAVADLLDELAGHRSHRGRGVAQAILESLYDAKRSPSPPRITARSGRLRSAAGMPNASMGST